MLVNQFVTSGCTDASERGSKLLPMLVNQSVTYDTELYRFPRLGDLGVLGG